MKVLRLCFLPLALLLVVSGCGNNSKMEKSGGQEQVGSEVNASNGITKLSQKVALKRSDLLRSLRAELVQDPNKQVLIEEVEESAQERFSQQRSMSSIRSVRMDQNDTNESTIVTDIKDADDLYNTVAVFAAGSGRYKLGLYFFLKASAENPTNSDYLAEVVASMLRLGMQSDATEFAELADRTGMDRAESAMTIGTYYETTGRQEEAMELYRQAFSLDPQNNLIRKFFFEALARYKNLGETLYEIRDSSIKFCQDLFEDTLALNYASNQETMSFVLNHNSGAIANDMAGYLSTFDRPEIMKSATEIQERTIDKALNQWGRASENRVLSVFDNGMDRISKNNQSCIESCEGAKGLGAAKCVCSCWERMSIDLDELGQELQPKVEQVVNDGIIRSFGALQNYEIDMIWLMNNAAIEDVSSLVTLSKLTYDNYKLACLGISTTYVSDIAAYYNVYNEMDYLGVVHEGCSKLPGAISMGEPPKKLIENEKESTGEESDDIFGKFGGCISLLVGSVCVDYDHGLLTLKGSSGPIEMSSVRDLNKNIGVQMTLGVKGDIGGIISVDAKVVFDNNGDFKGIKGGVVTHSAKEVFKKKATDPIFWANIAKKVSDKL